MTLTKDDIVKSIQNHLGIPKTKSTELIECLLETFKKTLVSGDDVLISGFGKFCVKNKNKRRGRNPATGKDLMLASRRVVTFKCSPVLRSKVKRKK